MFLSEILKRDTLYDELKFGCKKPITESNLSVMLTLKTISLSTELHKIASLHAYYRSYHATRCQKMYISYVLNGLLFITATFNAELTGSEGRKALAVLVRCYVKNYFLFC
jgi:hypothetical protein